jgi:general nucleoside transport system ATP-binding protein
MPEILRMSQIVKVYPNGVVANKHVDLSVDGGEIHALVGENGTGKTTLMKILFGIEQATAGQVFFQGEEVQFRSPIDAIQKGLGMVHQHFMLVGSMSVAENIVLGMEPMAGPFLSRKNLRKNAEKIIAQYNFDIDPAARIDDLPIGTRQKVEILKALYRGAKLLILDEPTAVLTPQETTELFKELKALKAQGHTIIFISHKLGEVKEICDRITIMRSGKTVGVYEVDAISKQEISNLMVGKELDWKIEKGEPEIGETVLKADRVGVVDEAQRKTLHDVSFSLKAGRILGVVGVEGNGQRELVEAVTALRAADTGKIELLGRDIAGMSIKEVRRAGLAHIPQDRMVLGIAQESSIQENLISTSFDEGRFNRGPFLDLAGISSWSRRMIEDYQIKADSEETQVKMLSGGNIQKVVVAREFSSGAKCIIADQPTRGIDVGAAKFIHRKLIELRDAGAAIMLISADLSEVMDVSDSLIVLYGGRITAFFPKASDVAEDELGLYMLGIKQQSDEEIRGCMA